MCIRDRQRRDSIPLGILVLLAHRVSGAEIYRVSRARGVEQQRAMMGETETTRCILTMSRRMVVMVVVVVGLQ